MSARLYPEIIVLSIVVYKIDNMLLNNQPIDTVTLSINECLQRQKDINYSPALNVFTSQIGSDEDWKKDDYEGYFKKVRIFYYYTNDDTYILSTKDVFSKINFSKENRGEWLIALRDRLLIQ